MFEHWLPKGTTDAKLEVWKDDGVSFVWNLGIQTLEPVAAVKGVQQRLDNLGFPCGEVDGKLGTLTKAALRSFQATYGLPPSGAIDDATKAQLEVAYDRLAGQPVPSAPAHESGDAEVGSGDADADLERGAALPPASDNKHQHDDRDAQDLEEGDHGREEDRGRPRPELAHATVIHLPRIEIVAGAAPGSLASSPPVPPVATRGDPGAATPASTATPPEPRPAPLFAAMDAIGAGRAGWPGALPAVATNPLPPKGPEMPKNPRYGLLTLRLGDTDITRVGKSGRPARVYEGRPHDKICVSASPVPVSCSETDAHALAAPDYVRRLQEDLIALGFRYKTQTDGNFDLDTERALREFQIYARMPYVAKEHLATDRRPLYVDRLEQVPNTHAYGGKPTGVLDQETANLLAHWKAEAWRCPVVVVAVSRDKQKRLLSVTAENLWRFDSLTANRVAQPTLKGKVCYVLDLSGYFQVSTARAANEKPGNSSDLERLRVSGYYLLDTSQFPFDGGPLAPGNPGSGCSWPEAAITPESFMGKPYAALSPAERCTFRSVRALAERECGGRLDGINAYDRTIISGGLCHWALCLVKRKREKDPSTKKTVVKDVITRIDPGELMGFLAEFARTEPEEWERLFGVFGLHAPPAAKHWCALDGTDGPVSFAPGTTELHAAYDRLAYLKSWHWAYRIQMAGRTSRKYHRANFLYFKRRYDEVLDKEWKGDAATWLGSGKKLRDVFSAELLVTMLVRWHVFLPAEVGGDDVTQPMKKKGKDVEIKTKYRSLPK